MAMAFSVGCGAEDKSVHRQHAVVGQRRECLAEGPGRCGVQGQVSVKVSPRMRSNSGDTCCTAALQHQGIVLQPSFMVGEHTLLVLREFMHRQGHGAVVVEPFVR